MQVVIAGLGINMSPTLPVIGVVHDLPLLIAFAVLALYTYTSGLRAPALIAVVKDLLIYATVLAAVIIIPAELGGYGKIFAAVDPKTLILLRPPRQQISAALRLCHAGAGFDAGAVSLSPCGDGAAVFLQPPCRAAQCHGAAGLFLRARPDRAAGLHGGGGGREERCRQYAAGFKTFGNQFRGARAVPAHVSRAGSPASPSPPSPSARWCPPRSCRSPAAIFSPATSIASSSIPIARPRREAQVAKIVSLVVKLGALFFMLELQSTTPSSCSFWAASGSARPLPAVLLGLYTRWLNPWALLIGWAAGMASGTWMAWTTGFKISIYPLHIFGVIVPCYAAVSALVAQSGRQPRVELGCSTRCCAHRASDETAGGGLRLSFSRSGR